MGSSMDLSIVVVNFNTYQFTRNCLDSISSDPPAHDYEIVVVDNASTDDSGEQLTREYPNVKIVRSGANLGIAGGNNAGIRASHGRFILLLNNDTIVLPGVIDRAIIFLQEHPQAAGVGGQLLNEDGTFQSGHFTFPTLGQIFMIVTKIGLIQRPYYPSNPPGDRVQEVDWISTAFMLFRREALQQVGFVDEEFFIYSDESDLQYRLRDAGWRIYYYPALRTIHFGGKSLTPWTRRKMVYRGYLLFFRKHYGRTRFILLRGLFATVSTCKLPIWLVGYLNAASRGRARKELASNLAIIWMSIRPGISQPL